MLRLLCLFVGVFLAPQLTIAQQSSRRVVSPAASATDSAVHRALNSAIDSIGKVQQRRVDSSYIEVLERVNNQLALRWSPMGVFLGAIAVVIGLGAVWGTLYVWWQTQDFKTQRAKILDQMRVDANRIVEERTAALDAVRLSGESLLAEMRERLTTLPAEQRRAEEGAIARLEASVEHLWALRASPLYDRYGGAGGASGATGPRGTLQLVPQSTYYEVAPADVVALYDVMDSRDVSSLIVRYGVTPGRQPQSLRIRVELRPNIGPTTLLDHLKRHFKSAVLVDGPFSGSA